MGETPQHGLYRLVVRTPDCDSGNEGSIPSLDPMEISIILESTVEEYGADRHIFLITRKIETPQLHMGKAKFVEIKHYITIGGVFENCQIYSITGLQSFIESCRAMKDVANVVKETLEKIIKIKDDEFFLHKISLVELSSTCMVTFKAAFPNLKYIVDQEFISTNSHNRHIVMFFNNSL